ncbi:MAG TPA: S-adenosyl-l-methionine hydroxide adenosyltransferase family protein [Planctomycetota bacterium]|nr:S-adenosyl-l-methionine hydroxide adenosyltransferase family protein [Planctomycetota bacterium]HRR79066.1 S-adenosyl-l-methionine hydroxide adenosyltransferase family protein [Planctomycetota bacterium]HRT93016.1 S-adenosyl-l-methionine hydroxide adenosyltransferase family protein [Planctomycetota bacterium]
MGAMGRWVWGLLAIVMASCAGPPMGLEPTRSGLLVLLTDFGERDHYVAAAKGAAYRVNPAVRIESITHEIAPFDVWEGAVTLALAAKEFPPGTVFVAVVDPGVGTKRRAIAIRTEAGHFYVAPDNGLLTFVIRRDGLADARDISDFQPLGHRPSRTFQGRDLFVPSGALLAGGASLGSMGLRLKQAELVMLPVVDPTLDAGRLRGSVLRVDRYGNVVTNLTAELIAQAGLKRGDKLAAKVGEATVEAVFASTYGDVPQGRALALIDSIGHLELAVNLGDLAQRLQARPGLPVEVWKP